MTARVKRIKVLVADDQNLFRDLMVSHLKRHNDILVAGEAISGADTLAKVNDLQPDVVLLDIHLGDMDGIEVTSAIKSRAPSTRVLLLTGFHHRDYIIRALRAGASGYLSKDASMEQVLDYVRKAYEGEALLDAEATTRLIREFEVRKTPRLGMPGESRDDVAEKLGQLTRRELEILGLIADGLSNQDIANRLFISEYTVKTHISNLFRKLKINDRVQAVLFALENGVR